MPELSRFNGIVYADDSTPQLKVTQVRHVYGGVLILRFSNNEERLFDTTVLTEAVFEPLKDLDIVSHPVLEHGVVTWLDSSIDCSPEYMYENSFEYNKKDIISVA